MGHMPGFFFLAACLSMSVSEFLFSGERVRPGARQRDERLAGAEPLPEHGDRDKGGDIIRLRRLTGLGERGYLKTPNYRAATVGAVSSSLPQDWAEILLTYDVIPDWIDELTMRFFVLTQREGEKGREYNLFKASVTYVDVEKGRNRMAPVYLTPVALKRYGRIVAIGVEVVHEGKVIAEMSETDVPMPAGEKWWRSEKVVDSKLVTARNGYLLNRAESPFCLINIDDYPTIRR